MQVDWPGLLKWSLQYTDGTRAEGASLPKARPKEDLEFLESAIASAMGTQVDIYKLIQEAAPKLYSEEESEILAALGLIQEGLDIEPELARNLHKIKLVDGLVKCLEHSNTLIKETDASILQFALGNNEVVQKAFLDGGLLKIVMRVLEERREGALKEGSSDELRLFTKFFGVLSALVKHQRDAEDEFLAKYNGIEFMQGIKLQTQDEKLLTKLRVLQEHFQVLLAERKNETSASAPLALM